MKTISSTIWTMYDHHVRAAARRRRSRRRLRDRARDHAREEHRERVHDALEQRHRHHVAVGDVRDLVAEHALDLGAVHALRAGRVETATSERDFVGPGRERVDLGRVVDADLGHRESARARQAVDRLHELLRAGVARARVDDLHAHRPLGHDARERRAR